MNDQFQHVMVLISIIIGLAITHLLSGVVDAVDRATDEDARKIFALLLASVAIGMRSRKIRTQTIMAAIYFVLFVIAIFEYTPVLVVH